MKFIHSIKSEDNFIKRFFWLFFTINFIVWFFFTKNIRPDLTITPTPPGKHLLKLFSMGDDIFVYRHFGYKIQMAGDDYGTTTPLRDYSYDKLQKWFLLLNEFDNKSEFIPSLAGLYFSNSQNPMDNTYIVDYLLEFVKINPSKNWRWATTSLYLANTKLHDKERIKIATELLLNANSNDVPLWARSLGIFIMEDKDICQSVKFLSQISKEELTDILNDKLVASGGEKNPFQKLIVKRLDEIKKNPLAIKKCFER